MKRVLIVGAIIVATFGIITIISLATNKKPPSNTSDTSTNAQSSSDDQNQSSATNTISSLSTIDITRNGFEPKNLTVKKGATVMWINEDAANHTVTGYGNSALGSTSFGNNRSYSFTFNEKGTYLYSSIVDNENYRGAVIVIE